jgi:hypothetical protein
MFLAYVSLFLSVSVSLFPSLPLSFFKKATIFRQATSGLRATQPSSE